MVGTVFAKWLEDAYQDRLHSLATHGPGAIAGYYGVTLPDDGSARVTLNGACGLRSMLHIAESCGLQVEVRANSKGRTTALLVLDVGA